MPSCAEPILSQILECGYFITVGILSLWVFYHCELVWVLWVSVGILSSPEKKSADGRGVCRLQCAPVKLNLERKKRKLLHNNCFKLTMKLA